MEQDRRADGALEVFGALFGGATAYPKARGIWRDDERGGALVRDEPVAVYPAIRRRRRSRTRTSSAGSLASAGGWAARLTRERLGS